MTMVHPLNFRDVGEALGLWLDPSPIATGRLLRGGKFDQLATLSDLGLPATILNLRSGPDPRHLDAVLHHVPAANDVENYDTRLPAVRAWLKRALAPLASAETTWPVYVHCTSGRDRTGVVVAAVLHLHRVPREVIVEEYLLSDGGDRGAIERALDGIAEAADVLGVDRARLRAALALAP